MSRSTIGRILSEADLKPHRSVYWLNSHDPDFDAKARSICQLYLDAPRFHEQGRLVLSSDEKTGMQILQRKYPTRLARPGIIEKREFEYIRHGTRALLTTFCVPTGQVVWNLGPTRTSIDWVRHLDHVATQFPLMKRFDWVVDNLNTHWSLEVCQWVARRSGIPVVSKALQTGPERRTFLSDPSHKHVFHFTPIHGSWLNQVELFFSVLSRRFLKRGDFASAESFEERIQRWLPVKCFAPRRARPACPAGPSGVPVRPCPLLRQDHRCVQPDPDVLVARYVVTLAPVPRAGERVDSRRSGRTPRTSERVA
jgi:transposase